MRFTYTNGGNFAICCYLHGRSCYLVAFYFEYVGASIISTLTKGVCLFFMQNA